MNSITLMGRLTMSPELKHTPNNVAVTSLSIAVNRQFKSSNGEYETDFINIVAWKHNAEFITRNFSKGQFIAIQGSLQTRQYTDKEGHNRTAYEILVGNASFCGDKKDISQPNNELERQSTTNQPNKDYQDINAIVDDDLDLPF